MFTEKQFLNKSVILFSDYNCESTKRESMNWSSSCIMQSFSLLCFVLCAVPVARWPAADRPASPPAQWRSAAAVVLPASSPAWFGICKERRSFQHAERLLQKPQTHRLRFHWYTVKINTFRKMENNRRAWWSFHSSA